MENLIPHPELLMMPLCIVGAAAGFPFTQQRRANLAFWAVPYLASIAIFIAQGQPESTALLVLATATAAYALMLVGLPSLMVAFPSAKPSSEPQRRARWAQPARESSTGGPSAKLVSRVRALARPR